MIVARIHNNSIGQVFNCDDEEHGKEMIRTMVQMQFRRHLSEEEEEILENNLDFSYEQDDDNSFCFSIVEISSFEEFEEDSFNNS
jgi:predicted transcriptional regulator YdeE